MQLGNGQTLCKYVDVGVPVEDVERQWQRLQIKFRRLAEPVIGSGSTEQFISLLAALEEMENLNPLLDLCTQESSSAVVHTQVMRRNHAVRR